MPTIRLLHLDEEGEFVQTQSGGILIHGFDADCVFSGEAALAMLMDSALVLA